MNTALRRGILSADHGQETTTVASYRAPAWLPGGHLQTVYAYFLPRPSLRFCRQRCEIPDGDFIDFDWLDQSRGRSELVVLFHGLEGCSTSHYAVSLMNELQRHGRSGVVAHSRACSGELNRLARGYHAGDSAEVDWILRRLKGDNPKNRLYVVGISIGGNDLLKWLGEQADRALDLVERAVAVSVPLDLQITAKQLDFGLCKLIYTRDFLKTMRPKVLAKISTHGLSLDPRAVRAVSTFREIDNIYTAPIHGFRDADDYWIRSSSKPWLSYIKVPTLLINARNDPFFPGEALPTREEVSDKLSLEYPETGGHVGFVSGSFPGHLRWLPQRILNFFAIEGF